MLGLNQLDSTRLRFRVRGVSRFGTLFGAALMVTLLGGCPMQTCDDASTCPDDGLFCTGAATCTAGLCGFEGDPCLDAGGVCNEETDSCDTCGLEGQDACDDGNECTDDACVEGSCVATNNTAACDDADACTDDDVCTDGVCGGTAADCDDADACTDDSCDAATGDCVNAPMECADGETCVEGACVLVCDDAGDCDDGDACTDDACVNNACTNTQMDCDDSVDCTDDSCADGACVNTDNCPDGETCDATGNACTSVTACEDDATCDDGVFCNGAETCDLDTGDCVAGTRPCAGDNNGGTCDDGTTTETCSEGDAAAVCTACPAETFDFTLNQDNLTGTGGDDIFSGGLLFNSGSGTSIASLQTGDTANGLAGTDTLDATVNGTAAVPTLAGIENINFTAFAATTITGTNITGVDSLMTSASTATLTVNNMQELTGVGLKDITDGTSGMTIGFATAATTGSTDDIAVAISGSTGAGTLTVNTGATNGHESVSFTTTGSGQNVLNTLALGTGTSMATGNFAGDGHLQVRTVPNTIRTYDGSSATGNLMLGTGTSVAGGTNYATFGTMNVTSLKTGTGDDTVIFNNTLDTNDKAIDLGMGTDVVQASIGATISTFLPFTGVEEVRLNATASGVSVNLTNVTGLTDVTNEADGTANTLTINGVSGKPNLNFRGNNTQAAQTFDTLTYVANDATGSSDTLAINVNNRGTALNATGTTNVHTVGGGVLTAANFETVNTTVSDGPATFSGMTCAAATAFTFTASSNLTLGTVTGATGAVSSVTASGVVGNLSATFAQVTGTVNLGNGTNTVTVSNTSGASVTVSGGTGADTVTCNTANIAENINGNAGADVLDGGDGLDTINGGDGNDTITSDSTTVANADADTITTGSGVDTIILLSNAASSANSDTISDFTTGASGDQFDLDLSSLESAGASDNIAVDFVELQDGSSVVDTDTILIHECAVGSGCTPAANANVIVLITGTVATTALLETALEAGGGTALTIAAAGGDAANAFPVVYTDGTNAYLAICHAEAETTNNTSFDSTDLTCLNLATMSGNTAIAASEFNAANFDFIP